jgi:hypothetical protein
MAAGNTTKPRIVHLADELVADINARNLKPGDRYLTTTEASKLLVVGNDIDIVVCDYFLKPGERPEYVWARPEISSSKQGRRLAQLLLGQIDNGQSVEREKMPVELELPFYSESKGK